MPSIEILSVDSEKLTVERPDTARPTTVLVDVVFEKLTVELPEKSQCENLSREPAKLATVSPVIRSFRITPA